MFHWGELERWRRSGRRRKTEIPTEPHSKGAAEQVQQSASGTEVAQLIEEDVLHEVNVGGTTITFLRRRDTGGLVLHEQGGLGALPVLDLLQEQHGSLTLLERFLALAPAESEPSARLVSTACGSLFPLQPGVRSRWITGQPDATVSVEVINPTSTFPILMRTGTANSI